jgi:preprotein translocase subunit SecE
MEVQEKKVAQVAKAMPSDEGRPQPARPAWLDRLLAWPQQFRKLLHDVRGEMGHVTWPPPTEVRGTTLIVLVTIFFFGVFFFVVDMGVSKLIELILKNGR